MSMTKYAVFVKQHLKGHHQTSSIQAKIVRLCLGNADTRFISNAFLNGCRRAQPATNSNPVPFVVKNGSLGKIQSTVSQTMEITLID